MKINLDHPELSYAEKAGFEAIQQVFDRVSDLFEASQEVAFGLP